MKLLSYPFVDVGRLELGGAPDGFDALALADFARGAPAGARLLHIARDDQRMAQMASALACFAPDIDLVTLPAWDCLPYDRVSPHADVLARRVAALARLENEDRADTKLVTLTTVSATLQRVPPGATIASRVFEARCGDRIDLAALTAFLVSSGYARAGAVREPGEFAVRGGIVDIFPPGSAVPLRLDLFGDELERVRTFDPDSQRSMEMLHAVHLLPIGEVVLDDNTIARFRAAYRGLFGAVRGEDPLYEAVSAGRRFAGMEHWLPLFYARLDTVLDHARPTAVTLDHQAHEAVTARWEMVSEYYDARQAALRETGRRGAGDAAVYKPVPPDMLFLSITAWQQALAGFPCGQFSPFPAPGSAALDLGGRRVVDFSVARKRADVQLLDTVQQRIADEQQEGRRVVVTTFAAGVRSRIATLLQQHGVDEAREIGRWGDIGRLPASAVALIVLDIDRGFTADGLAVFTEQDIFGERLSRPVSRRKADNYINEISALSLGDLVVHVDHGIGRYDGLETLEVTGAPHDCARLIYAGDDRLYVPVENLEMLSRFGSDEAGAQLDRLGRADWQARKARVRVRIKAIAGQLLKLAAERELRTTEKLTPSPGLYEEFAARFPYAETEDQARAIDDVIGDLSAGRPADRLICGDVGFGKTEVAMRAAFIAVMAGLQVAIVVPTTLLARQHHQSFGARFDGLPVRIEQLSRLVAAADARKVREGLASGDVDIVIGTHALLAKSIRFKRLGLLVVDEEQHFGVAQKERLKSLRAEVHVLTLTATPIPRTLQMALTGVRDMSLIATPPVDRLAVRTFVMPYDSVIVREAIMRERFRGGQVFYVCPRVQDMAKLEERLRELVPEVKIAVAHGRMAARELERVMTAFDDLRFDVLLSTNIIESGLDIPTANTLIVHRADMFGLAQLYQLRGRVGRSNVRAYAYLTVPAGRVLGEAARKRLDVMQTLDSLGAGFTLASHDLDIRGAGNLLGEEQSGQIKEVGVELYQQMLEDAVAAARETGGEAVAQTQWTPTIAMGAAVLIPESYVADLGLRLGLYRRIAGLVERAEIDGFAAEMIDRFGPLPAELDNLLEIVALKHWCRMAGIDKLEVGPRGAVISFRDNRFANPGGLVQFISTQAGTITLRPNHKLVYRRDWADSARRIQGVRRLVQQIADLAQADTATAAE